MTHADGEEAHSRKSVAKRSLVCFNERSFSIYGELDAEKPHQK